MTSRIDQGLAPTSVVKISGLDQAAFSQLVSHLCETFHISPPAAEMIKKLYQATSGSPLFVGSVLRLVSLGENLLEVVNTWAGQDGEEVRDFAFKREIERLTISQAQHLYPILLLGETSINDLAKALDVTPRLSRERASELQAYHLIAAATTDSGDTVLTTPNDLVSVTELIKNHLGPNAQRVEQACATTLSRGASDLKSVGLGIRQILTFWESSSFNEAVIVAKKLRERFPKSGDAASILGAALMRTKPPKFEEANRELEFARALGCGRPELLENLIKAKIELREWAGLHDLTKRVSTVWLRET